VAIIFNVIYENNRPVLKALQERYNICIDELPEEAEYRPQDYDEVEDDPELRALDRLMKQKPYGGE
jgi:hypothetical protein